ncbi:MAG: T9SS type A sorting domain-containing protein [Chitinophagaceae bacterium]|nr:T9SS type A sorting domain-containing protein [Chitinophagaceae bacterium]
MVYFINNTIIPSAKSDKVLSMGDYNSYFEEDPLDTIRNSGFLILSKPESYSYLYQGQLGSLDNAFVNNSFLPFVTGIAKWNINSVEPSYLDYEDDINDGGGDQVNFWGFLYNDGPYRCSDHDPVLVGLQLGKKLSAPVLNIEPKADFELYPNPSRSVLLLSKTDGNKASVLLMNAMGQQLQNWDWLGKNTQINTEYLPSGLYFVKVLSTGKSYPVKRFVKE